MTEFELIKRYFATQMLHRADVVCGIGDDAALLAPPTGQTLAMTTDTLISGIHFPEFTLPYDIGYKSLAVNLSDLAAMGATPAWALLSITLPQADENWIQSFCDGFFTLANRHQVQLIGGDLTHGSTLSITVQAIGFIPEHQALLRRGAKPNDLIYVSGSLGDAGLALKMINKQISTSSSIEQRILERLQRPEPRISTGENLRGIATACIDISDGLAADLGHLLDESQAGAVINVDQLPLSEELKHAVSPEEAITLALTAGDDYELCFTVPANKQAELEKKLATISCRFTCIGEITSQPGLELRYQDGRKYHGAILGYRHF